MKSRNGSGVIFIWLKIFIEKLGAMEDRLRLVAERFSDGSRRAALRESDLFALSLAAEEAEALVRVFRLRRRRFKKKRFLRVIGAVLRVPRRRCHTLTLLFHHDLRFMINGALLLSGTNQGIGDYLRFYRQKLIGVRQFAYLVLQLLRLYFAQASMYQARSTRALGRIMREARRLAVLSDSAIASDYFREEACRTLCLVFAGIQLSTAVDKSGVIAARIKALSEKLGSPAFAGTGAALREAADLCDVALSYFEVKDSLAG